MLKKIEENSLNSYRNGSSTSEFALKNDAPDEWIRFSLTTLLKVGQIIRDLRLKPIADLVHFKADGSPATTREVEIEEIVRTYLARFCPDARLLGEETGGEVPTRGLAAALDPIDGTWAFINRMETCATSLAFFQDGVSFLGLIMNPVTGEIAYTYKGKQTRLLQLSLFGEEDAGFDLPLDSGNIKSDLINIHPNSKAGTLMKAFYKAWQGNDLDMVRMAGGSPAYAMLEAAKGNFTYINLWSRKPAAPYDLAAAVMLVRGAGGEVVDVDGRPINEMHHSGPFTAGLNKELRNKAANIIRNVMLD